jgi:regulator of protease activity HflC (stomatin/prohibitin superfamily)
MTALLIVVAVVFALTLALAGASVRVLREYERGVVFRFGRLVAQKGPGLILLVPIADRMVRVTLRTITHTIPPQDMITRDNVPARVDAVAYFRVVDADASVIDIEDCMRATSEIAKTTLRSVVGKAELDTLLAERERLNEELQHIIDEQTEPWGVKVVTVEIKDVVIPQDMQRAMARQAEAERDRRAMVINAEAEYQAAARLAEAAQMLTATPAAMQLRYLQTLAEVGKGQGSTVLLPLPLDALASTVGLNGRPSETVPPAVGRSAWGS